MGGGSARSRQISKPVTTPEQKLAWAFYGSDIAPLARGEETWMTRQLAQKARDVGARQARMNMEQIMQIAAANPGISGAQIASLQREAQNAALQQTLQSIANQRLAAAQTAMQMISGLPMISRRAESKTEQKSGLFGLFG